MSGCNSTLTRKKPLRAKFKPWEKKSGGARLPATGKFSTRAQRKPLKKISRSQRGRLARYYPIQTAFLALPHNAVCAICLVRDLPPNRATEVHHIYGRAGTLLFDVRGFAPSCRPCRTWPHENPAEARELGILAPAHLWNVPFERHQKIIEKRF